MHKKYLGQITVKPDTLLRDIVKITNLIGTSFVVDSTGKLVGIITDGDMRRAPLRGMEVVL